VSSIGIIGGGIVGLATAYKLALRLPSVRITLFEKESAPGLHQSTHNSGVLHAGLYYKPGSTKATLAVSGLRQMLEFCRENEVPHEQCGKLVIATNEEERAILNSLYERGKANGLKDLRKMEPDEFREREPHACGVAAVCVPEEGIVDYGKVIEALAGKVRIAGHRILTGWRVSRIQRQNNQWRLRSDAGEEACDFIINTAGLYCDRVSRLAGEVPDAKIVPFRGEYFKLRRQRRHLVRHLIYPTPDSRFPFLGVHFTRTISGEIEAGPNAVLAFAREGYRKTDFDLLELAEVLCFGGFSRFVFRHWRMCWHELHQSFSKRLFVEALRRLIPEVQEEDLEVGDAGVRAQAMRWDGTLLDDFHIIRKPAAVHVLNAPSPAATASLAIADVIVAQAT
jgi:(S)-2-hydroxyglutarate dehydrogenase